MPDDADYADLGRLLADPESWTVDERRLIETTLEQQRHMLWALKPTDTKGRARITAVVESIEKALKQANCKLAATLADLPYEHLLDVLRRVFVERRPNPEEDAYNHNRFFLGDAKQMLDDDLATWGPWQVGAVAYPDPSLHGDALGPGGGFYQFGECQNCGTKVRCNLKQGICPICESSVYMT